MLCIPFIKRAQFWAFPAAIAIGIATMAFPGSMTSASASSAHDSRPTVVLVHGAWADGSSWNQVSSRLQKAGYEVRVPPNNLRGVVSDAADLASYLSTISGPIVLVGHSYGGMVITNAAIGNSQVLALVYVDAYIPAEGDTLVELTPPAVCVRARPGERLGLRPLLRSTSRRGRALMRRSRGTEMPLPTKDSPAKRSA